MLGSDVARLMVQLLLIAPAGSFVEFDSEHNEIVLVLEGGMSGRERRAPAPPPVGRLGDVV